MIGGSQASGSDALVAHLNRFPEDLRDIRRLQRSFGLSQAETVVALDAYSRGAGRSDGEAQGQ